MPFAAASAAFVAVEQVEIAAAFAWQLLSWPQMKLLITSMLSADPWLNEPVQINKMVRSLLQKADSDHARVSTGAKEVSRRPSRPAANLICGVEQRPKLDVDATLLFPPPLLEAAEVVAAAAVVAATEDALATLLVVTAATEEEEEAAALTVTVEAAGHERAGAA